MKIFSSTLNLKNCNFILYRFLKLKPLKNITLTSICIKINKNRNTLLYNNDIAK